jgi:hypothetical protein
VGACVRGSGSWTPNRDSLKVRGIRAPFARARARVRVKRVHACQECVRVTSECLSPEYQSGLYAGSRIRRFRVRDRLGSDILGGALEVWP